MKKKAKACKKNKQLLKKNMSTDARARIDSHHLMRGASEDDNLLKVDLVREELSFREKAKREKFKYRVKVHLFTFVVSFIFTIGASVLGILLWVRPESFVSLVVVGLFSSAVFVFCFTGLRMLILHKLSDEDEEEKELGINHHLSKSIAYSLVALVFAVVLAGLIVNIASANVTF